MCIRDSAIIQKVTFSGFRRVRLTPSFAIFLNVKCSRNLSHSKKTHLQAKSWQPYLLEPLCALQSICHDQECCKRMIFRRVCISLGACRSKCMFNDKSQNQCRSSLDTCRSKCISCMPKCALARRPSIQMHVLRTEIWSGSTPVDPNAI